MRTTLHTKTAIRPNIGGAIALSAILLALLLSGCELFSTQFIKDHIRDKNGAGGGSPTGPGADEEDFGPGSTINDTFDVSNATEWKDAIGTINSGAGNYIVNLTNSFSLPGESIAVGADNPRITSSSTVSIRGSHTIRLSANGNLLYINTSGVTVTFRGPTLQGKPANNTQVVKVENGYFYLRAGTITRNTATTQGGGVAVSGTGSFIMSGGTISSNFVTAGGTNGGGVTVGGNGTFSMSGGTISGNAANATGGGVYVYGTGSFTMSGGTISDNAANTNGGGVSVDGGSFEKTGGTVTGTNSPEPNTAITNGQAVYVSVGSKYRNTTAGPGVNLNSGNSINWE